MKVNIVAAISLAISTSVAVLVTAVLVDQYGVSKLLGGFCGALVGTASGIVFEWLATRTLRQSAWGREILDPRSVYAGAWLQVFGKSHQDRPYTIVRFAYNMDTQRYTGHGTPYLPPGTDRAEPCGDFHCDAIGLDLERREMQSLSDGYVTEAAGTRDFQTGGSITFHGSSRHTVSGRGQIFSRDSDGVADYEMVRLTRSFVENELGITDIKYNGDLDRSPDIDARIVAAYHKWNASRSHAVRQT